MLGLICEVLAALIINAFRLLTESVQGMLFQVVIRKTTRGWPGCSDYY